jgi:DnaJ like chaperone protein
MTYLIILVVIGIIVYYAMNLNKKQKQHPYEETNNFKEPNATQSQPKKSYGKWIGGGLGWAFGGPIGAIMGFAFGSMYDGMQTGKYEYKPTQSGDFSVSLLILSAAIMKADGRIMRSELEYVKQFFIRQFGAYEAQQKIILLKEILKQEINIQEVSLQIKQYMDYSARLQLLHFLFGISLSDGELHSLEIEMIDSISSYLGLNHNDYISIKAMFVKDIDSAYKILEVSPESSDDEIKKAYHKMAVKYHPDKVAHLGEDIKTAAKEKFQKLNAAYEEIKKQRGVK